MRRKKEKTLRPIRANAGIGVAYRRKLLGLVDEMYGSYKHWISATYRRTPPAMAQDGSTYRRKQVARTQLASRELERELSRLGKQWERKFDDSAQRMAGWFAKSSANRTDAALGHILRKGGWTVEFKLTMPMRDSINAIVAENVSLIRSIPSQFYTQVEGLVMRSVTAGRDLAPLVRDLQHQFGVTRRRAEFIALDQNNKATAMLRRVRELETGIDEAIWLHSHAGKKPRPTHVAQHGKKFSIRDGWPDPALNGKLIWPGTEPRCRCTWKPIVKGFS
jgi:SPP1 gp7 family putative phage head morphogenesis protein